MKKKHTATRHCLVVSAELIRTDGSVTYVEVMVRNRSCPAVSQICSFTLSPSSSTVRILKSTPMVVIYVPVHRKNIQGKAHDERN